MQKWLIINAAIIFGSIGAASAAEPLIQACCECCNALVACVCG
jgi:hypothetical protein